MPQVGVFYPLEEIVSGETAAAFSDAAPDNSAGAEMAENNFDAATEVHGQGDEASPEEPFDRTVHSPRSPKPTPRRRTCVSG